MNGAGPDERGYALRMRLDLTKEVALFGKRHCFRKAAPLFLQVLIVNRSYVDYAFNFFQFLLNAFFYF